MHSVIYFVCVIWCSHVIHSSGETLNSCNNTLQYQREGNESVGLIEIQSPPSIKTLKLEIVLSLPGQLPSLYVGSIEPFRTVADAVQRIRSNQHVQYKVRFPLQNPLPKLKELSINGQAICKEPQETGSLITEIQLGYTLFTEQTHPPEGHAIEQTYTSKPQQQYTETNATASPIEGEICGRLHEKYNSKVLPLLYSAGDSAGKGTWPWLVSIYSNKQNVPELHCAGSLISHRTVVTAASCFRTKNRTVQANEVVLILGQDNIVDVVESGIKDDVEELVIHKDFMTDVFYDADIALAIIRERVNIVYLSSI